MKSGDEYRRKYPLFQPSRRRRYHRTQAPRVPGNVGPPACVQRKAAFVFQRTAVQPTRNVLPQRQPRRGVPQPEDTNPSRSVSHGAGNEAGRRGKSGSRTRKPRVRVENSSHRRSWSGEAIGHVCCTTSLL